MVAGKFSHTSGLVLIHYLLLFISFLRLNLFYAPWSDVVCFLYFTMHVYI